MDQKEHDKILAFDTLFTNNHIQILKILMPIFDSKMQSYLAVYIKYMEFQYTISYFKRHSFSFTGCSSQKEEPDIGKLCDEILAFCTKEEKGKVEQIRNMMQSMERFKEISKTMAMMKDLFPEGVDGLNTDMLSGMFSSDQSQMFDLFSMMGSMDGPHKD